MHEVWGIAALWMGLALIATLLSIWLRIATALSEIVVGTVAQLIIGAFIGTSLGSDIGWIKFLSGTGAIVLTFLAGAELDPVVFKAKLKEASAIGFISFLAPFLGCTAAAYYLLHWSVQASWLAGVALSTTSVAVVYAVMLELGLNKTDFLRNTGSVHLNLKQNEVVVGRPADQIIKYAKDKKCDMVIVGQKGKSKIENWLVGSVSKRVATYSPRTVTIVKQ